MSDAENATRVEGVHSALLRFYRASMHSSYRTALTALGDHEGASRVPDIRYYDPDLLQRLESEGNKQAEILGSEAAEADFGV